MSILTASPEATPAKVLESDKNMRVLIDWLAFTIPDEIVFDDILEAFSLKFTDLKEQKKGLLGYQTHYRFGEGCVFLTNGRKGMGTHIFFTGKGCREIQEKFQNDWRGMLEFLLHLKANFSRLDVAVDDFSGLYTLDMIEQKVIKQEVASYFQEARVMSKYKLAGTVKNDADPIEDIKTRHGVESKNLKYSEEAWEIKDRLQSPLTGKTVYFGSAQSRIQVRFYDKKLEMAEKDQSEWIVSAGMKKEDCTSWNRCEMQLRDERADVFVKRYVIGEEIGELARGVLMHYIRFIEPSDTDMNKSRSDLSPWWDEFLMSTGRLKLTLMQVAKTLQTKAKWLNRQASVTMAMMYLACGERLDFLADLVTNGMKKIKQEHRQMLDTDYVPNFRDLEVA